MGNCYIELRKPTVRASESGAADMMRHLRTRQHLGKVLVLCDQPELLLATARKQWMKLSRAIQKQRASTLNADKILKYTHTIIHMQNLRFSTKSPLEDPDADAYFLPRVALNSVPVYCFTVYLHEKLARDSVEILLSQLPTEALIVDYIHGLDWAAAGLQPKVVLEQHVSYEWRQVRNFLRLQHIDITELHTSKLDHVEAMDDALDALLGMPHKFLQVANDFQHTLELARPLRISKELRMHYDALMLLAHRVQALTATAFSRQFLESYNEDDTFFLYDHPREHPATAHDANLEVIISRHRRAGRHKLATALQAHASTVRKPGRHRALTL